jgi:uncharacterized protein YceK
MFFSIMIRALLEGCSSWCNIMTATQKGNCHPNLFSGPSQNKTKNQWKMMTLLLVQERIIRINCTANLMNKLQ